MAYSHNANNLVPQMSGNTTPSPYVASASSEYNSTYAAFGAFDRSASTSTDMWDAGAATTTGWLKFDFGSGLYAINGYGIYVQTGYLTYNPKSWTFEGSNNNSDWTVLDTRSNQSMTQDVTNLFTFSNNTIYRYYRLNVSANNGGVELIVTVLEMYNIYVTINGLQKIPHDTARYANNPVELINIANRQRIGTISTTKHNYIGA